MRIGLVGYGGWGRVHASAIARIAGLSLAAWSAATTPRPVPRRHDLPGVPVHRDLDALLARSGRRPGRHRRAQSSACRHGGGRRSTAGKHVLLEKPMATTLADAERLVAAAERSGRHLGIGLQLRVSRQWARVRELIAEGAIGRMRFANLTLFRRPFGGGSGNWRRTRDTRRLVDPRGADPLHRPAAVVLPRARPAGRGVGRRRRLAAGARHVRRLHLRP